MTTYKQVADELIEELSKKGKLGNSSENGREDVSAYI